jgi:phosphoribosyl 1,2-cyclic phosphodiesterase
VQVWSLGSGSRGNAIGVRLGDTTILIDAGFGPRAIAKRADAVGFPIEALDAVVVTHEHRDHAGGVAKLAAKHAIPVYATRGTLRALDAELGKIETIAVTPNCRFSVGTMTIDTCPVPHDAREPIAVAVNDSVGSRVAIAYDLGHVTERVVRFLSGSSAIVIEANHDNHLLYAGPYPPSVRARIAGTRGHLSNEEAGALLQRVHHKGLQWAMLAHVSQNCNTSAIALETVGRAAHKVGFRGELLVTCQSHPMAALSVGKPTQLTFALGA